MGEELVERSRAEILDALGAAASLLYTLNLKSKRRCRFAVAHSTLET